MDKKVVKNIKFNTLNTKLNSLEKKISHAFTLTQTNQCNTNKQNLEKKIGDVDNKVPDISGLVATTALNTKLKKLMKKYYMLVN